MAIISLLRVVTEEGETLRIGLRYSLENRQNYNGVPMLTPERIISGLQRALDNQNGEMTSRQKKSMKKPGDALRKALANSINEFPPMLIEHALQVAAFDPKIPLEDVLKDLSLRERLVLALGEAQRIVEIITISPTYKGYIISKPAMKPIDTVENPESNVVAAMERKFTYEDFHPFRPRQFEVNPDITILEFDGYNRTADEFFSTIESQKLESRLTEREENAKRKLETARLDYQKRLGGLQHLQELNVRKAQAIEANLQRVQEATDAMNALISQGIDWQEIARLIEIQQGMDNDVADTIKLPLNLTENIITLFLSEDTPEIEDDYNGYETGSDISESEGDLEDGTQAPVARKHTDQRLAVDIDLALSPWSNARQYYEQKRSAAIKEQKTLKSSGQALKSTEKKINADLKRGLMQEKEVMRPQRRAIWFEKFLYFISSEGYLVLGGKDTQQNEILYKRYLQKGDKYIHADLQGAACVIVKNKPGMLESPIPPSTLSQAGTLAIATSSAWDSKAVMSAWWVDANQVSKIAPTGDLLPNGSFMIIGNKNFLPPAQPLLGCGIMFKVSETSKAHHLRHRVQDPLAHAPSNFAKIVQTNEGEQGDTKGVGCQPEDQYTETDDDEIMQLEKCQEASSAGSNREDKSMDGGIDTMHQNSLESTHDHQSTSQPPSRASDSVIGDLGTGIFEGTSNDSIDEGFEGEQREIASINGTENDQNRRFSARDHPLSRKASLTEAVSTKFEKLSMSSTQPDVKFVLPRVRGKHGKNQKLKAKYVDQDEEDRATAMQILGTAHEKPIMDAVARADKEKDFAVQRERRRRQNALIAEKGKEAEELRKINFEEGVEPLDETELEVLADLDAFIGTPIPGDEILDALVVCGPWDAIGARYKWRVKLQPGTMNKGKAVREILSKWNSVVTGRERKTNNDSAEGDETMSREEKVTLRERELIRAIRESEVIGAVPVSKIRIVMGQGEANGKGKGEIDAFRGKRRGNDTKRHK